MTAVTPIIGLLGRAGAGKDTVWELLAERHPVMRLAFADQLKQEVCEAWCCSRHLLDDPAQKGRRQARLAVHHCSNREFIDYAVELSMPGMEEGLQARTVMQRWGDWRRAQDPDYFLRPVELAIAMASTPEASPPPAAIVVTDVRFPNEAEMLRKLGAALWRIERPDHRRYDAHRSERLADGFEVDHVIRNSGSVEQLAKIASDLFIDARIPR